MNYYNTCVVTLLGIIESYLYLALFHAWLTASLSPQQLRNAPFNRYIPPQKLNSKVCGFRHMCRFSGEIERCSERGRYFSYSRDIAACLLYTWKRTTQSASYRLTRNRYRWISLTWKHEDTARRNDDERECRNNNFKINRDSTMRIMQPKMDMKIIQPSSFSRLLIWYSQHIKININ